MAWLRDRIDARALDRAVAVFARRGWVDAPDHWPVISGAVTHMRYRAKSLRSVADREYRRRHHAS